jgi:hypothetical protein
MNGLEVRQSTEPAPAGVILTLQLTVLATAPEVARMTAMEREAARENLIAVFMAWRRWLESALLLIGKNGAEGRKNQGKYQGEKTGVAVSL